MPYSFNPNPIVGALRILFLAILLSLIAFTFKDMIERIFIPLVGITWLVAVIYIAILYARAKFEVVTLEETSIKHTRGVLAQKSVVLSYSKITEATYTQTLFQRVIGIGDLHLDSAGGSFMAIHVNDVKKTDIDRTMENARNKSGKGDGT